MRRYAAYDIFRPRVASTINCTCFTQALSLTQGVVRESRISILGSYHPSQVITCSVNTTKKGTYFGSYTNQPKNNGSIFFFESVKYSKKTQWTFLNLSWKTFWANLYCPGYSFKNVSSKIENFNLEFSNNNFPILNVPWKNSNDYFKILCLDFKLWKRSETQPSDFQWFFNQKSINLS